jgi:toxin HigB-1
LEGLFGKEVEAASVTAIGALRDALLGNFDWQRDFQGIARRAKRKLEAIKAASRISDLAVPPSNHLEKLRGDLQGFDSIRINDQWRVIFRWSAGDAAEVQIVDYR